MVSKGKIIFGLLFLFSISFGLAATTFEETSLGEINLPWINNSILVEDALVFIAIFVIFFAIILELINLLGLMEKAWMRVVSTFIIVLLINMDGLFFKIFLFLKDTTSFTNWILGLTFWNWIVFIISLVLIAVIIILLRKLIAQWKLDSQKEEEEVEKIQEEGRKKLQAIKNKYRNY